MFESRLTRRASTLSRGWQRALHDMTDLRMLASPSAIAAHSMSLDATDLASPGSTRSSHKGEPQSTVATSSGMLHAAVATAVVRLHQMATEVATAVRLEVGATPMLDANTLRNENRCFPEPFFLPSFFMAGQQKRPARTPTATASTASCPPRRARPLTDATSRCAVASPTPTSRAHSHRSKAWPAPLF